MRPHADINALNLDTYGLSLITAKEDLLNDRISTDWAVFTYEKKWSLKLLDSGVGGLEELIKKLNKNLVLYGLCRVPDPNAQGPRFILIYWVGENVDPTRKEISVQHLPAIRRFFKEAHVMLRAHRIEDISQEAVTQALNRVPQPARSFHRTRLPGSHEVVGTNYTKTNPAIEMKFSMRDSFWQRNEREEERRKEHERLRLQEERIAMEKARIERERLEEEERERRIQEKEIMVEEQRREQARMEVEQRRIEKARWAQQQRDFEEEMKGRFKRSQSIEMAAEAAALVSGRSLHPRDVFRQHERSVSCSNSPPSTPSSPRSSPSFSSRTTFRYQRSMTESILTPPSRSPSYFPGFQKRDSFSGPSFNTPPACSPAFIFSKAPLPGTSAKVDSLPSYIPPPISTKRGSPSHVKENISPQSSISPPQSSIVPPQGSMFPPQRTILPSQSSISPQSTLPPPQSSMPSHHRTVPPLQSTQSPQPYLYDVPYRAEYVTLSTEESPQPNNTCSEKKGMNIKAQTRPPALNIPPPTNFDTPDATDILTDVYRAEFVPIDSLNTSGNFVEQGHSPKSPRSFHTTEGPAAIKATVSISSPVSEIVFASVTPVTDAKISASPLSTEAPGLTSPLSAKAIGPTPHEVAPESVLALQASSTSAEITDQRRLPSPPVSVTAGYPPEAESNFYTVSSYESSASSKTTTEGLLPSPLPESPIALEGKTSPVSSSLRSILQYVAPPPYTPFSARTTDSVTVKAPAFVKSLNTSPRFASSNSARNLPEILSTKAPNIETVTVNSNDQREPQIPPCVESQERTTSHLPDKPPHSQTVASNETNDVQAVDLAPASSPPATISQPATQPIEYKAEFSSVDNLYREDSLSTSQMELNKDKPENLTLQAEFSSSNLPEVKTEPIFNQTEVLPAVPFPVPQTEPIDTTCKIPPAQPVSIINLPESQVEAVIPPTEVLPSSVSPLTNILPDSQTKPSEKHTDASPVESLPVVASPLGNLPKSQDKLSEKQTEVSPVEPLPMVAFRSSIVPDPQDELSEKQTEVSAVEPLSAMASQAELSDFQANLPILPTLPAYPVITNLLENQGEPIEKQAEVQPTETLSASASLCSAINLESQTEDIGHQTEDLPVETVAMEAPSYSRSLPGCNQTELPLVEMILIPENLPTGGCTDSQLNNLLIDPPHFDTLPVSVSLPTERSPKSEPAEYHSEVPLVEAKHESVSLPTDNSLKLEEKLSEDQEQILEPQTLPVSSTLPKFQSEPSNIQTYVSSEAAIPVSDSLFIDRSPESQAELRSNHTEVPLIETLSKSTFLPSDYSSGYQANQMATFIGIPPADFISVSPTIPQISSNELQEPCIIQTEVPPNEPVLLPASLPLDGTLDSQAKPIKEQIKAPPIQCSPATASLTANMSCESSGEPINDQSELPVSKTLPVPASIPTDSLSEPQADTYDRQPEILSDIVPSLQTLPVTSALCIKNSTEGQTEPKVDITEVPRAQPSPEAAILLPDSSFRLEDEAYQTEVPVPLSLPVSLPIEFFSESSVNQPENLAQEDVPASFSLPVCNLPVEIRDIEIEFLPTEGKNEFTSFPRVISPEVQDEPRDRPSGNITELAPLLAISQPDFFAETNEHPSEFPLIGFSPGLVSLGPDLLVESQADSSLENSELLKPDTFIASMILCTDESAEFDIEEDYSQSSTETSFLPTLFPSSSSSEFPAKPIQVPPADSTSLTLIDDSCSTSLTDTVYWARSVDSSLLSASFPTNISMKFAADPNGNLIEVESRPVCSSLLTDGSSEFLPPPPGPSCVDDAGVLEAPLFCDSLPATNLNLFEDPHPGSPPVTGSIVEPYRTGDTSGPETKAIAATENTTDKVIVHDILPINNLPVEENQTPKDFSQCNSDLVNLSSSSAFVDQKHPTLIPTENALQTAENNIPDNNNTVPSQVVL